VRVQRAIVTVAVLQDKTASRRPADASAFRASLVTNATSASTPTTKDAVTYLHGGVLMVPSIYGPKIS